MPSVVPTFWVNLLKNRVFEKEINQSIAETESAP